LETRGISEARLIQHQWTLNNMSQSVDGGLPGRKSATLQACDLRKQCAVRELNPQPADSEHSVVDSCAKLWKPLRDNGIW
jgi:hypothetical protein